MKAVGCGVVLLLATIGLLTQTPDIPNMALYAAIPSYAPLLIAFSIGSARSRNSSKSLKSWRPAVAARITNFSGCKPGTLRM